MLVGIVIPAKDEEEYIVRTLQSLIDQGVDLPFDYEVVVVENGSSDRTADVLAEMRSAFPRMITLWSTDEPSAIGARILGAQHLCSRTKPVQLLISGDADTTYPHGWLRAIWQTFQAGADVVSCAGYIDPVLWERCPSVVRRYTDELGSIFFDPGAIERLGIDEDACLFTHQIYVDFGRPLYSPGFAITTNAYVGIGGFRREYYDADGQREILIAATPLMFRAELAGLRIERMDRPWWLTSPRRLLAEPDVQLGRRFQHTAMRTVRAVEDLAYREFDARSSQFDYQGLRLNCVRDYILTPCVVRPTRIVNKSSYFGKLASELADRILAVRSQTAEIEPRHIFDTANDLTERYGNFLLEELARHRRLAQASSGQS